MRYFAQDDLDEIRDAVRCGSLLQQIADELSVDSDYLGRLIGYRIVRANRAGFVTGRAALEVLRKHDAGLLRAESRDSRAIETLRDACDKAERAALRVPEKEGTET